MAVQVAFLRAINVGNRRVAMDRLRQEFEELGLTDVATFIASGNVIFTSSRRAADLESEIERALRSALGFAVTTFVRSRSQLDRIVGATPFSTDGPQAPVHVGFLKEPATASTRRALEALSNETDTLAARGREIYWLPRNGMGRATVSGSAIEKALGQPTTLRSLKMLGRLRAKLG